MISLACNWSTTAAPAAATAAETPAGQPNVSITRYSPDNSSGEATQTPFVPQTTLEPSVGEQPGGDIATPEEVIYTVLTNYDTDSEWVKPYLTENLQAGLSSGGVMELMGLEGDLEGLVFQAGSTSSDPNFAYVEVALQVSGEQVYRVFTLIRGEAGWKIDSIETLEPE